MAQQIRIEDVNSGTALAGFVPVSDGAGGASWGAGTATTYAGLADTDVTTTTAGDLHTWDGANWIRSYGVNWQLDVNGAGAGEEALFVHARGLSTGAYGTQLVVSSNADIATGPVMALTLQEYGGGTPDPRFGLYDGLALNNGGNAYADVGFSSTVDGFGAVYQGIMSAYNPADANAEARVTVSPRAATVQTFGVSGVATLATDSLSVVLDETTGVGTLTGGGSAAKNTLELGNEDLLASPGVMLRGSRGTATAFGVDSDGYLLISLGAAVTDAPAVQLASRQITASTVDEWSALSLEGKDGKIESIHSNGSSARLRSEAGASAEAQVAAFASGAGGIASARVETNSCVMSFTESTYVMVLTTNATASLQLTGSAGTEAVLLTTGQGQQLLGSASTDSILFQNSTGGGISAVGTTTSIAGNSGATLVQLSPTAASITAPQINLNSGVIEAAALPSYADDTAAGVGGLTAGQLYQTSGAGASPLNVAGIVMVKQ